MIAQSLLEIGVDWSRQILPGTLTYGEIEDDGGAAACMCRVLPRKACAALAEILPLHTNGSSKQAP
jgi:hypothetical protein